MTPTYSPSISLVLTSIVNRQDDLGNRLLVIEDSKEVVGINKSITSSEFQTSHVMSVKFDFKVVLQAFIYNGQKYAIIKNNVYKVERTYVNGQFIELYLSLTEIKVEDLVDDNS